MASVFDRPSLVLLVAIATTLSLSARAAAPALTITSPTGEIHYKAGQSFNVVVDTPPSFPAFYFSPVSLLSRGPFVVSNSSTADPYNFVVRINSDAQPGDYAILAVGGHAGKPTFSTPIHIIISAARDIEAISSNPPNITLPFPGSVTEVSVNGSSSAEGITRLPISQIVFSSQNRDIVTIDAFGRLVATGRGSTSVSASYGKISINVPVTVLAPTRGDLNGDTLVDERDVRILSGALNTKAAGPVDARDLNRDGKINALDLRILTTLCTYPRCVTKP